MSDFPCCDPVPPTGEPTIGSQWRKATTGRVVEVLALPWNYRLGRQLIVARTLGAKQGTYYALSVFVEQFAAVSR